MIGNGGRIPFQYALNVSTLPFEILKKLECVEIIEFAGSMRRKKPTVKDVDILVCSSDPSRVVEAFLKCGQKIDAGDKKASIYLGFQFGEFGARRLRMDLMLVKRKCWGAALCHFTGSKEHNISLRALAKSRSITVSQNGITATCDGRWLGGEDETDLYRILDLRYIEPEGRDGSRPDLEEGV